jgi:CHAT domain-containing protein/tetratricopeptide (TPR) repeat protein
VEAERDVTEAETARATNTLDGCREAVQRFRRAASLWQVLREPYEEGVALYGLALAHRFLGEHEASLRALERMLALMRQANDAHGLVMAQSGLGWTSLYLDDYDTAASRFRQALSNRGLADRRGSAGDFFGLGWTELLVGQPTKALARFKAALGLRRLVRDRRGEALTLVGLAAALDRLGRWEEASQAASQAFEIHGTYPDRYGQADALTVKAWALLRGGHAPKALEHFVQAAKVRRALEDVAGEAAAIHGQAAALEEMGESGRALELADRALAHVESVRVRRTDHDLRATYFASVQDLYDLCIGLLLQQYRTTGNLDAARRAFHVSERARARSLLDLLALRRDGRGSNGAQSTAIQPLAVEDVQRALDTDTTMLVYATGSSRSVLWLVGRDQFGIYELPPRPDIEHAARDLLESIAVPPPASIAGSRGANPPSSTAAIAKRAKALARLVLPGEAARQARGRIVVVPSGALQLVPFGVLPRSTGAATDEGTLLEHHEIITLPSASMIRGLRRMDWRTQPRKTLAAFADPVLQADDARVRRAMEPGSSRLQGGILPVRTQGNLPKTVGPLPRLFATRWEAREIGRLFPAGRQMVALDFRAARSTLERLDLSAYQILHFGTHAVVDLQRPERSGLVLSLVDERGQPINGFIPMREILEWPLEADLVVLSGCRTGVGREIRGEGLMALSRAFLAAGASRLVISLWSVDDRATAELMARFYRRMLGPEHMAPAAALRAAQLEMRAQPRWRSPYFWAGFVLQGEWH